MSGNCFDYSSGFPERSCVECSYSYIYRTQITEYDFFWLLVLDKIFVVFEPDEDEKNEKEYKKIHDDYKNLVF